MNLTWQFLVPELNPKIPTDSLHKPHWILILSSIVSSRNIFSMKAIRLLITSRSFKKTYPHYTIYWQWDMLLVHAILHVVSIPPRIHMEIYLALYSGKISHWAFLSIHDLQHLPERFNDANNLMYLNLHYIIKLISIITTQGWPSACAWSIFK